MTIIEGKGTVEGIAIGKISIYEKGEGVIDKYTIEDPLAEIARFHTAKDISKKEIEDLSKIALTEIGEASVSLFEAHIQLIEDIDFIDKVEDIIFKEKINAEYAVIETRDFYMDMFSSFEDEYMKARVSDIIDISTRVIRNLQRDKISVDNRNFVLDEPRIIYAEDLTPSESIQLDKKKVLAFITKKGTASSHTSILARMMSIPAVVNVQYEENLNGIFAIVDGYTGKIILEPTDDVIVKYEAKVREETARKNLLLKLKGKKNITSDGRSIDVFANIGSLEDLRDVEKNDAGGIGLFRTEFLFLKGDDFPTEEEQFNIYKQVALRMKGKKVVIRTLDVGADKQIPYFPMEEEINPAMGYRGIRISLTQTEMFKTQLSAIYRASAYGNIAVLFPMIISVDEVHKIKSIIEEVKCALNKKNMAYGEVEIGVMIETPAAVMISDELAELVDFFSIGTNDLTQYTLAIDRQNHTLDDFYNPHHKAIFKMIKMVADNAHKNGCKVSICGELASDKTLTENFLDMGVDTLSVSPSFVFELRNVIRNI